MHKSYQTPRACVMLLAPESLIATSNFIGNTIESFGIEERYGSTQSTSEGFGETNWGSGGASNEGFKEKNIGE